MWFVMGLFVRSNKEVGEVEIRVRSWKSSINRRARARKQRDGMDGQQGTYAFVKEQRFRFFAVAKGRTFYYY
jgi:hypothetical protein